MPDVVALVLEHLTDKADFARCALVHSDWPMPAQKQLFKSISILSPGRASQFVLLLRRSTHLQSFFQSAHLQLFGSGASFDETKHEIKIFTETATVLPAVRHLTLVGLPCMSEDVVDALGELEQLMSLRLSRAVTSPHDGGREFSRLLTGLASLTNLDLEAFHVYAFFGQHGRKAAHGPSKLTSLKIKDSHFTHGDLDWLVHSSAQSLQEFTYCTRSRSDFREANPVSLIGQLANLKRVHLEAPTLTASALRSMLPGLNHLENPVVPSAALDSDGLTGAPDSLKHLHVTSLEDTTFVQLAARFSFTLPPGGGSVSATMTMEDAQAGTVLNALETCPLGRVDKITLVERPRRSWRGVAARAVSVGQARRIGIEIAEGDEI